MACTTLEELLASSLLAAQGADGAAAPGEKLFEASERLFLATEFGAAERSVVGRMGLVLNLTGGHGKVPNYFPECCRPGRGGVSRGVSRYVNYELVDQPGENIGRVLRPAVQDPSLQAYRILK